MYNVKTEQADDQTWGAWCDDAPVFAWGAETKTEALSLLRELIDDHIEWARKQASRHLQAA